MATSSVSIRSITEIDLVLNAQSLPAEAERRLPWQMGALPMSMALFSATCVVSAAGLDLPFGPLITVLWGAMAIAAVLFAVHLWRWRERWTFTPTEVRCAKRGLFGTCIWTVALRSYAGVLAVSKPGGQDRPSQHIVRLEHRADKRRSVVLFRSTNPYRLRERQVHYAGLLGVSALTQTADGLVETPAEDLGKPIRERVQAGHLQVAFDPTQAPPAHLTVAADGPVLVIRTSRGAFPVLGIFLPFILALGGIVALVLGVLSLVTPAGIVAAAGVAALVASGLVAAGFRVVQEELRVSPDLVSKRWLLPWGAFGDRSVPAGKVEEVIVKKTPGGRNVFTVQAIASAETVHFGMGLPKAAKRWVRDCIIAVISK